ncbi:NAD(P)H-hydrate dehydratase [Fibrobacter sp.]|uniref:NAD(P)H-hydrate dehydratase n=1 Tax=Fibrobacter sp. TaxID=35828 RepID=UPI0025C055A2|nr:NAD(P)H-hydrate dehydratase [Fibrobacter sp.]MBR3073767.1 NAD(P)H-hydrate dehydratase [Fibrobacter sp.]
MSPLSALNLTPILSTGTMRKLDASSKTFLAEQHKESPSEQDVIQSGYTLMQEAGLALFKFVQAKSLEPVAVFIGGGNNGGDGLVLAKHLLQAGIKNTVFSLAPTNKFQNEAKLALKDFFKAGGQLYEVTELLDGFKLVVDCMLGNGAKGELRAAFANAVQVIHNSGLPVIAADAPTGYDSAAHICNDICIHANETMLFGFPRLDAYEKEGGKAFGKTTVANLSYPDELVKQFDERNYLVTEDAIPQLLPKRDEWGDKRVQGTALIIAGSKDMPGAAALCTEAALRSGAGLVTLATSQAIMPVLQTKISESVFCGLVDNEKCSSENYGTLQQHHIPTLLNHAKHANAVAIGPGLSTNKESVKAVLELLPQLNTPTVIDADALNAIATLNDNTALTCDNAAIEYLQKLQAPAILTPHVREFARLFGKLPSSFEIPNCLRSIATSTNKVLLLKGAPTYIAAPDGNVYVIPVANSGMAKGGSGDVLTGIIAALLAQGIGTAEVAVLGALLHQKAGRIAREEFGAFSMLPSDIIKNLHKAFSAISA